MCVEGVLLLLLLILVVILVLYLLTTYTSSIRGISSMWSIGGVYSAVLYDMCGGCLCCVNPLFNQVSLI